MRINFRYLTAGFFIIVAIGLIATLTNKINVSSQKVKITVLSGEVTYQSDDGAVNERIKSGEELNVSSNQLVSRTLIPSTTKEEYSNSNLEIIREESIFVALDISIIDTENKPLNAVSCTIQNATSKVEAKTDENGLVAINDLPIGAYVVSVTDDRIFPIRDKTIEIFQSQNQLTLTALRRVELAGFVKTIEDQPIANARLILSASSRLQEIKQADLNEKSTKENGSFRFSPLVSGTYVLTASAPGYLIHEESVRAKDNIEPQTIYLHTKSRIMVHVQDNESNPIFSAKVTLKSKPGTGSIVMISETSDTVGFTEFEDVPPGEYVIYAEHVWYTSGEKSLCEIKLVKDRHEVTLTLENRESSVSGRVLEKESGEPISNAKVVAYDFRYLNSDNALKWDRNIREYTVNNPPAAESISNLEGTYQLNLNKGGSYVIGVLPMKDYVYIPIHYFRGFRTTDYGEAPQENPVVMFDGNNKMTADIALEKSWIVSGNVFLDDGSPIVDATIVVRINEFFGTFSFGELIPIGISQSKKSTNNGYFEIINNRFIPINKKVYISAEHSLFGVSNKALEIKPSPGTKLENIKIVFDAKAKVLLKGNVYDEVGKPIPDASITFVNISKTVSDSNGLFEIYIASGEYEIIVTKPKYKPLDFKARLDHESIKKSMRLVMEKETESFEGVVIDNNGNPVSGCIVEGQFNGVKYLGYDSIRITDKDGRFSFFRTKAEKFIDASFEVKPTNEYDKAKTTCTEWASKNITIVVNKYTQGYSNINGKVFNSINEPIQNYSIFLIPSSRRKLFEYDQKGSPIYQRDYKQIIGNPYGKYSFEQIPVSDGPFVIVVNTGKNSVSVSKIFHLQKDQTFNIDIMHNTPSFTIKGRIIDKNTKDKDEYSKHLIQVFFENKIYGFTSWRYGLPEVPNICHAYDHVEGLKIGDEFTLNGIPVQGGKLRIHRFWNETIIPIAPGQPGEVRDLGTILIDSPE